MFGKFYKKKNPADFKGKKKTPKHQRSAILGGFVQEDFICKMKEEKVNQTCVRSGCHKKILLLLCQQKSQLTHTSKRLL